MGDIRKRKPTDTHKPRKDSDEDSDNPPPEPDSEDCEKLRCKIWPSTGITDSEMLTLHMHLPGILAKMSDHIYQLKDVPVSEEALRKAINWSQEYYEEYEDQEDVRLLTLRMAEAAKATLETVSKFKDES